MPNTILNVSNALQTSPSSSLLSAVGDILDCVKESCCTPLGNGPAGGVLVLPFGRSIGNDSVADRSEKNPIFYLQDGQEEPKETFEPLENFERSVQGEQYKKAARKKGDFVLKTDSVKREKVKMASYQVKFLLLHRFHVLLLAPAFRLSFFNKVHLQHEFQAKLRNCCT